MPSTRPDPTRTCGPVDLPQRRPLDDVRQQGEEVHDRRGRDRLVAQRAPRAVGHARSSCSSATRPESTASVSAPPERSRAAISTRVPSGAFGDAQPDPAGADEQRAHQPEQREHDAQQRDVLARRLADLDPLPGDDLVEGDAAQAVRQLDGVARCQADPERLPVLARHRGRLRLVEGVDRLRGTGVQVEVAGVDVEREQRVYVLAAEVDRRAVHVREGRVEVALQPDLARLGVRRLDHAEREQVRPHRQERHRAGRRDVPVAVAHGDHRCVAVPDQEQLGPADLERVVHPEVVGLLRVAGRLGVAELGVEPARHPGREPLHVEVVDGEGERVHAVGVEQAAGDEVVVLREVVAERQPLDQDHAALEAEQRAGREADQDHQHRQVEDQVAELAEVAALGADRRAVGLAAQPVALAPEQPSGALEHHVRRLRRAVRRVAGQAGQVARRRGRLGAQPAGVDEGARDDAAEQRDDEQDVDRREPRGAVDVEDAELLVDRGQRLVRVLPLRRLERVHPLLRDQRPRHRGQREHQQQDQRDPHRRELAPGPAQELAQGELAGAALRCGCGRLGLGGRHRRFTRSPGSRRPGGTAPTGRTAPTSR